MVSNLKEELEWNDLVFSKITMDDLQQAQIKLGTKSANWKTS